MKFQQNYDNMKQFSGSQVLDNTFCITIQNTVFQIFLAPLLPWYVFFFIACWWFFSDSGLFLLCFKGSCVKGTSIIYNYVTYAFNEDFCMFFPF